MLLKGLKGEKENRRFNTIPVVETNWGTIKKYFPSAKVLAPTINSSKDSPPDGDNSDDENSPESGEYAYGILDNFNNIQIFKYSDFSNKKRIDVSIQSQKYIVYGDASKRIINAFKVSSFADYEIFENEFPFVLEHQNGTKYNILGKSTNGSTLQKPTYAYVAIWRAWEDFYSGFTFQE